MKKVTKIVEKQETVTVCDTCGKETGWKDTVEIDISWSEHCPRDDCYWDDGSFEFCSYECFVQGAKKLTEKLDADENFYYQPFTIRTSGVGEDGDKTLSNMLKNLAGISVESKEAA